MQTHQRRAFIEAATRWIRGPDVNLAEARFSVGATDVDGCRLWQRQAIAVFGLDHFGEALECVVGKTGSPEELHLSVLNAFPESALRSCHSLVAEAATQVVQILRSDFQEEMDAGLSFELLHVPRLQAS
jgi:hypothetical protein